MDEPNINTTAKMEPAINGEVLAEMLFKFGQSDMLESPSHHVYDTVSILLSSYLRILV